MLADQIDGRLLATRAPPSPPPSPPLSVSTGRQIHYSPRFRCRDFLLVERPSRRLPMNHGSHPLLPKFDSTSIPNVYILVALELQVCVCCLKKNSSDPFVSLPCQGPTQICSTSLSSNRLRFPEVLCPIKGHNRANRFAFHAPFIYSFTLSSQSHKRPTSSSSERAPCQDGSPSKTPIPP